MSDDLVRFLEREGVIDILCAIPARGIGFGDLLERVRISRGTLNARLREGLGEGDDEIGPLQLWGRHTGQREDGKTLYVLKRRGRRVNALLSHHGMPELLREIIAKSSEFDRQQEQVLGAVREHGLENASDAFSEDPD